MDYAVYAYGTPSDKKSIDFINKSLKEDCISRYLWSYRDDFDLKKLNEMTWDQMDSEQIDCWKHAHHLLDFKKGDWILHINVPSYGMVTAAQIVGDYYYDNDLPTGQEDGRHCFKVANVILFDRNDPRVHPYLSARLKLQGCLWRIYCVDKFESSLAELFPEKFTNSESVIHVDNDINPDEYIYLFRETNEILKQLTTIIQQNNPGKRLEYFLANVFKQMPDVIDVKVNGSKFGTDHGADLIITYKDSFASKFGIADEKKLVVQVKSFEGEHKDTKAVEQLKTAIEHYDATMGIIMTTGERTADLQNAFNQLVNELRKSQKFIPVYLLAGSEVAQFILQNGMVVLTGNK